jgi:hypothetical protein
MPEVLRGIRAIAQIRGYHLKFAHVGNNVPGDIGATSEGGRRSLWVLVRGTLLQDGDREVGSQNVGAEAALETITQAVLKPGDLMRNLARSQNDLVLRGMQRIEGVKQKLFRSPLAGRPGTLRRSAGAHRHHGISPGTLPSGWF